MVSPHSTPAGYASLSGDGRFVAVLAKVKRTYPDRLEVWDIAKRRVVKMVTLASPLKHNGVRFDPNASWSPGDHYIALPPRAISATKSIAVLDLTTGRISAGALTPNRCTGPYSNRVAWSPDGLLLVSASACDGLEIWGRARGRLVFGIRSGRWNVAASSFNPSGTRRTLESPTTPSSLTVIDPRSGRTVLRLLGVTGTVDRSVYSPDGRFIASASNNGRVQIWNARTGMLLRMIRDPAAGPADVEFGPDSSSILTVYAANNIRVIDSCPGCGNPTALLRLAEAHVTRQLKPAERQLYHVG